MSKVRPKKHLGQHFLTDLKAAKRIVDALEQHGYKHLIEIGPGTGVLTQYLVENKDIELYLSEVDTESVQFLNEHYPLLKSRTFLADFLHMDINKMLNLSPQQSFGIIGNFPYNISSQIFFRVLQYKNQVNEVVCMLQKEVAQRIASEPGNKSYGILSVLLQAYYDIEYLFTVGPGAFNPPPKVDSGVIRLKRNANKTLGCDEKRFFSVVKVGFNQRRKKLRNALKSLGEFEESELLDLRAEALTYQQFITLTNSMKS